jgi:hypothetical protein
MVLRLAAAASLNRILRFAASAAALALAFVAVSPPISFALAVKPEPALFLGLEVMDPLVPGFWRDACTRAMTLDREILGFRLRLPLAPSVVAVSEGCTGSSGWRRWRGLEESDAGGVGSGEEARESSSKSWARVIAGSKSRLSSSGLLAVSGTDWSSTLELTEVSLALVLETLLV